jgi:hypothetical protein
MKKKSIITVIVLFIIGGMFFYIYSKKQSLAFDKQRIIDLQNIKEQIINYWQIKGHLPATIEDLNGGISEYKVPRDPKTDSNYFYKEEKPFNNSPTFKLCANFDTTDNIDKNRPVDLWDVVGAEHWNHNQGYQCFVRIINTSSFPLKTVSP